MPKKKIISATVIEFEKLSDCPEGIQNLMQKAIETRDHAYSPYSNFQVGAAVELENGVIITGSNQENASYPAGLCAERTAIFYAGSKYPGVKILNIALSAGPSGKDNKEAVPPCGSCRQAIAEYEQKQKYPIAVYFMGKSGPVKMVESLLSLLPLAFNKDFLECH
jgi:cytidine deaminase